MTKQAELSKVFTDLDKTLIKGLDDKAWKEVIGRPLPFSTDLMTSSKVADRLTKLGLLKDTEEEAIKRKRSLMQLWYETLPEEELLFDDTHYFLTGLKTDGYPIYLVTTKHEKMTDFILARLGLSGYFGRKFSGLTSKRPVIEGYEGKKTFVTDAPRDMEDVQGIYNLRCIAVTMAVTHSEEEYRIVGAHYVAKTLTDALNEIRREKL